MTNQHRILSFDIGIKNLAYCFLENDIRDVGSNVRSESSQSLTNTKILDWKIVDLLNTEPPVTHNHVCKCLLSTSTKKVPKECGKKAKYQYTTSTSETLYFCESHAKNNKTYLIPKKSHEESALNKLKREGLDKLITEYNISLDASTKITKKVLVEALRDYYTKKSYTLISTNPVSNMTANKIDMITIGRNIKHIMDKLEIITTYNPTHIIMENQISTMASRMKTIQGELTMYFIMKFPNAHIEYISSANKLKHFTPVPTTPVPTTPVSTTPVSTTPVPTTPVPTTPVSTTPITTSNKKYRQHKQDAVTYTQQMLQTTPELSTWINTFNNHPTKKDDLADCFLQGIWYLRFRLPLV
jgi:hypothetical protein